MGWVENRLKNLPNPEETAHDTQGNGSAEGLAEQQWHRLVRGFELDVEEFNRLGNAAAFQKMSEFGCRISNPGTKTYVVVTADLPGQVVRYTYKPEDENTAVPEDGILTLRKRPGGVDLYSSDEHLTLVQVRQEILSPVFFPTNADELPDALEEAS
jgi:hypothetical protein